MAFAELEATESRQVDGVYQFDSGVIWLGLIAGNIGLLLCVCLGIAAAKEGSASAVLYLLMSVLLVAFLVHVGSLSGRCLHVSHEGVSVRDKKGNQIGSIHWTELGRVTERRKMAQLALWDQSGVRRVLIDQQYQNFAAIRLRVLAEYAKTFTPKPLPMEFRRSNLVTYETVVFTVAGALIGWVALMAFQQGQHVAGLFFLCFFIATLVALLNLYPQLRGPSVLFEDRLVLRNLFKTQEIFKKNVSVVEIGGVTNPQSGTNFSLVILRIAGGQSLKITSKYGSIPEIYLTLQAWLAQP